MMVPMMRLEGKDDRKRLEVTRTMDAGWIEDGWRMEEDEARCGWKTIESQATNSKANRHSPSHVMSLHY